jgi:hypothetical protein
MALKGGAIQQGVGFRKTFKEYNLWRAIAKLAEARPFHMVHGCALADHTGLRLRIRFLELFV